MYYHTMDGKIRDNTLTYIYNIYFYNNYVHITVFSFLFIPYSLTSPPNVRSWSSVIIRTMLVWLQDPVIVQDAITVKNGININFSITDVSFLLSYCGTGGITSIPMHSLAIRTPNMKREKLFTSDLLIKKHKNQMSCYSSYNL